MLKVRLVKDFGIFRRVWPTSMETMLLFTIGVARPFLQSRNRKLLVSILNPRRMVLEYLEDLTSNDKHVDTSGKPFFKESIGVLIPAWNADYYTHGRTYFKIFHSEDLAEFKDVYVDPTGTYGNHFFADFKGNVICIGVGRGWKGRQGKISYTPLSSYLLCSEDGGKHWFKIYELKYPSAIYDGIIIDDIILFTAREKGSVFLSFNKGRTFTEIKLSSSARNALYTSIGKKEIVIVSSDDSFYYSTDFIKFKRIKFNTKGLALRYPTQYLGKIFFTGVGIRSWLLAFDPKLGKLYGTDLTKFTGDVHASRLTVCDDIFFVGSELHGKLYFMDPGVREVQAEDYVKLHIASLLRYGIRIFMQSSPRVLSTLGFA